MTRIRTDPSPATTGDRCCEKDRAGRGRAAEALVAQEIESRGWMIFGRNVRLGRLEIDLLALHAGVVHVVEVRSRVGRHAGDPLETVGPAKRRALSRAVAAAAARGILPPHREIRYDVATVVWADANAQAEIVLHEGAFDALDLL